MSITATSLQHLRIDFRNSCDIDNILYQAGFLNTIYLESDVGKPEYSLQEEGDNNGENDFIESFQKWEKFYRIEVKVPEYMVDTLTMLPLHDYIYIWLQNGANGLVKDIDISPPAWETEGCHATMEIKFTLDSIVKTQCCKNYTLI